MPLAVVMQRFFKRLAFAGLLGAMAFPRPAQAQTEFLYWFTDDFDSYGNTSNFHGTNGVGWESGWPTGDGLRRFGRGGDMWSIVNGRLTPNSDSHCNQEYNGRTDAQGRDYADYGNSCMFGFDAHDDLPGTGPIPSTEGKEPIDNYIVRSSADSRADPDFGMIFQFNNVDDDAIGMVFRYQDHKNFYVYQWAWRNSGNTSPGQHLWSVSCCQGGHAAPICTDSAASSSIQPDICSDYGPGDVVYNRMMGRAAGHGGWIYRVVDGVPTELASTPTSYIQGRTYNVMVRGVNDSAIAPTQHRITIWMDRDNDGFQDADILFDFDDAAANGAIMTGGAYGLWQYDNSAFTVEGFVAQEAPIPPTVNPISLTTTVDDLNGFVAFAATSNRNATWEVGMFPKGEGACSGGSIDGDDFDGVDGGDFISTFSTDTWAKLLSNEVPGPGPGDYCWAVRASNSLGSDIAVAPTSFTILPRLGVSQPVIDSTGPGAVDFDFTSTANGDGTLNHVVGDCGGGGYAIRTGVAGAVTYAQIADRDELRLADKQTVEVWVNAEVFAANTWTRIVGKGGNESFGTNYALWLHSSGAVAFRVADGAANCDAISGSGLVGLANWHHIAGRYSGSEVSVIVDGVQRVSTSCSPVPVNSDSPVIVGWDGASGSAHQGLLAHVGIHAESLSDADLLARTNAGPVAEYAPVRRTVLLWHFRETLSMQAVWDSSGNHANGFLGVGLASDSADAGRWPTPGLSEASGTATTTFNGNLSGLATGQTYCARAFVDASDSGDIRQAYSPLRIFDVVADTVPPAVAAPATVALECSGAGGASTILSAATVTDDLDPSPTLNAYYGSVAPENLIAGAPYAYTFPFGAPGPVSTVIWQATDWGGNTATDNQTVWVTDTSAPLVDAGSDLTVEATSPSGTPVVLAPGIIEVCDAAPTVGSDALARYPLGTTTVNFTVTDAANNTGLDSLSVTIEDTTPPSFDVVPGTCSAILPDLDLAVSGDYVGPLPQPDVTDLGYLTSALTFYIKRGTNPETLLSASTETYGETDGAVGVVWRVVDPAGNECSASQTVNMGAASFTPLFVGISTNTDGSGATETTYGSFFNRDITAVLRLNGVATECDLTSSMVTFFPTPDSTNRIGNDYLGTYRAEAEYTSVVATIDCDTDPGPGTTIELGVAGTARFGIDLTAPMTDFSEVPMVVPTPTDFDDYPRLFLGENINLGAFNGLDNIGPVVSGIASMNIIIERIDDPAGPTVVLPTPELSIDNMTPSTIATTPLTKGPETVGLATSNLVACEATAGATCPTGTAMLSAHALSEFDGGERRGHRLVITIADRAGNSTTESSYFYLRDWNDALNDASTAAQELIDDPFNFLAIIELEDAQTTLTIADSYMALSESYTEGSYLRAQYALDYYKNAAAMGVDVASPREYLARAAWGDVRMYVDALAAEDEIWDEDSDLVVGANMLLNTALVSRSLADWGQMIRDVRDARDAVALLHNNYRAFRSQQVIADDLLTTNVNDWGLAMPHIEPAKSMISNAHSMLRDSVKPEIQAALTDPGTTQQAALNEIIDTIDAIDVCMTDLAVLDLTDLEFTTCYLRIDQMAATLDTVEVSLVHTLRWQGAMALALFGMLDMTMQLSPSGLPWVLGGGSPPNSYTAQEDWTGNPAAAWNEYEAAKALLRAGDINGAYVRFAANRCLVIDLYNAYYSADAIITPNVGGPLEAPVDPTAWGCP